MHWVAAVTLLACSQAGGGGGGGVSEGITHHDFF